MITTTLKCDKCGRPKTHLHTSSTLGCLDALAWDGFTTIAVIPNNPKVLCLKCGKEFDKLRLKLKNQTIKTLKEFF